jgi:hypothetical protein
MNALSRVLTKQPSHKKNFPFDLGVRNPKTQTSCWRRGCKLTHPLQNTPSLPWKSEQLSRHHFYLWVTILSRNISLVGWLHQDSIHQNSITEQLMICNPIFSLLKTCTTVLIAHLTNKNNSSEFGSHLGGELLCKCWLLNVTCQPALAIDKIYR